jgi:hypothetical protein
MADPQKVHPVACNGWMLAEYLIVPDIAWIMRNNSQIQECPQPLVPK